MKRMRLNRPRVPNNVGWTGVVAGFCSLVVLGVSFGVAGATAATTAPSDISGFGVTVGPGGGLGTRRLELTCPRCGASSSFRSPRLGSLRVTARTN